MNSAGRLDAKHGMFAIPAATRKQIFRRRNGRKPAPIARDRGKVAQNFREQRFSAEFQFPGIVLAQRLRVDFQMLGNPVLPRAIGAQSDHLGSIRLAGPVRCCDYRRGKSHQFTVFVETTLRRETFA
jgi:hypothetical protein